MAAFNDCLLSSEMDGDVKARCYEADYGGNGRNKQIAVQ
jgi:hypothetical protein